MSKKGFFTKVDNDLLRSGAIKPHELAVYLNLRSRQGNKISSWPSHATIARETSMSESKVKACIKWLEKNGLLSKRHRYSSPGRWTSNEYEVAISIDRLLLTHPQSPQAYKEDSNQEYSSSNSSMASNKKNWGFLDPQKPATEKQLAYLADLVTEHGDPEGLFNGEGSIVWDNLSQTEANSWIEMYWVHQNRNDYFS